jgi:septal ring factor EnvC (AmiA/AmiB activator)
MQATAAAVAAARQAAAAVGRDAHDEKAADRDQVRRLVNCVSAGSGRLVWPLCAAPVRRSGPEQQTNKMASSSSLIYGPERLESRKGRLVISRLSSYIEWLPWMVVRND